MTTRYYENIQNHSCVLFGAVSTIPLLCSFLMDCVWKTECGFELIPEEEEEDDLKVLEVEADWHDEGDTR